jgi:two-component system nitrate/nitrite response regulator NarL
MRATPWRPAPARPSPATPTASVSPPPLRAVVQGLIVLDDSFAAALLREVDDTPPPPELAESLTPREAEVLQLLTQGLANKAIAQRLGISDHTVKFHVNSILGKLGVQSRGEAIVQAMRLGLVAL